MKHHSTIVALTTLALALAAFHFPLFILHSALAAEAAPAATAPAATDTPAAAAEPAAAAPSLSQGEIPAALRAAFVQVELETQTSGGENPPRAFAEDLRAERPAITAGYLVAPDLVIAPDFNLPPRFVRSWRARHGTGASAAARPIAWAADRNAMLLKLDNPLPNTRPLEFAPSTTPAETTALSSCFSVKHTAGMDQNHTTTIEPLSQTRWHVLFPGGKRTRPVPANSIIATDAGAPLALAISDSLPADDTWKTHWRDWPWIYEDDLNARLEKLSASAAAALIHAGITLRPLPARAGENPYAASSRDDPSAKLHPAIILSPSRVLVLAHLAPAETARLENVTLRLADDTRVNARFIATASRYSAFVVEPEREIAAPAALPRTRADWPALRDRLLLTIDLRLQGETRLARPGITRILSAGYPPRSTPGRDLTVPRLADPSDTLHLFDLDGNFIGCPLPSRFADGSTASRAEIAPASILAIYADRPSTGWADSNNVPRDAAGERRLVWLGVDLQPLTRELAQAQGVSERTRGTSGGIVAKVHRGSPADRAGLQTGDILLTMRRVNSNKYTSISAAASNAHVTQMLTSPNPIPDTMYDRIPPPWPLADNPLNQTLARIGAGKSYNLDYARDGKFFKVRVTSEEGPPHYGNASEAVIASIGLNVKTLTFETRDFYKVPDDQSALIVSRVVAGSRASVAGLRPYDLILEVNDQPVTTPAAFAELAQAGGKLRLLTRRMSQTRIVTLDTTE